MAKTFNRLHCYGAILALTVVIGILIMATYSQLTAEIVAETFSQSFEEKLPHPEKVMAETNPWRNYDFYERRLPENVKRDAEHVSVKSNRISVKGIEAFYREALPPPSVQSVNQDVLLLHGAAFSSKTWVELNTMNILAALGYRVIATDLPGFGETPPSSAEKSDYLAELVKSLTLKKFILVSPSMSGLFSVPFVEKYSADVAGYVPVAPINTGSLQQTGHNIKVPTLIVYGEKDVGLGTGSAKDLNNIPTSQVVVLPDARHPAYLDQPHKFHTLLYNFIEKVRTTQT